MHLTVDHIVYLNYVVDYNNFYSPGQLANFIVIMIRVRVSPLHPFYIVKFGFTGVYIIIFLFLL